MTIQTNSSDLSSRSTLSLDRTQSISHWLDNFIKTRTNKNISASEGLFQYHMTQQEYQMLRKTLANGANFSVQSRFSDKWCAAFVLYGAEWFRREYSRDWSWLPIFQSLGLELNHSQISDIVVRGLVGYWNKPLAKFNNGHNDYIGSVFSEGGLPSNLLSNDVSSQQSNHYQNAFFAIFERYQDAKGLGSHAIDALIHSRITGFPETLQTARTVRLITNMIDKLDSLVYQFGLETQTNPALYLDKQFPRWRESFPLPLENETGSAFLSQLLSTASKEVNKARVVRKHLQCRHSVSVGQQAIYSLVSLPHQCVFELSLTALASSRLELAVFEGAEQIASLGTGFAQTCESGVSVRMRNPTIEVRRRKPSSELYVVAMQSGRKLAEIALPNSSLDIGESPLTLSSDGDKWAVMSQSTFSTRRSKVALLLPANATVQSVYGDLELATIQFNDLPIYHLNGQCEIKIGSDERYIVTSGSDDFSAPGYVLKGEQVQFPTQPAMVFKGIPNVVEEHSQAPLSVEEQLNIFLDNRPLRALSASEFNGRQLLTVKDEQGLVKLKKRVGILPKDFEVEFENGGQPKQGVIRFLTTSPCTWKLVSDTVTVESFTNNDGVKEVRLMANDKPPASVRFAIQANILAEPITIEVPFPARGAVAYNKAGRTLSQRLSVEDLLGSRLFLFSTRGIPATFQLEAELRAKAHSKFHVPPYFRWQYKVTDKPVEISLYGLKGQILELLSLSEMLDSEVELRLTGPGRTLTFVVSHYSTMLELDRHNHTVSVRSTAISEASQVKPVLMSLANPEQSTFVLTPCHSEGVATGEYELPEMIHRGGPWLVIPEKGSEVFFRAKFFPGETHERNGEVKTLQKASELFHPRFEPNVIADVIEQMAEDWSHSGWEYLKQTYLNYGHLPLSTFEVWRHLVRNERALAVAVFRLEFDDKCLSQMDAELPLLWETIEISHWQHAISLLTQTLQAIGIEAALVTSMVEQQVSKLSLAIPILNDIEIKSILLKQKSRQIPLPLMKEMMDGWHQDLLHTHCEDNDWPTEMGNELKHWCQHLDLLPVEFTVNRPFQSGVIYWPIFAAALASNRVPSEISNAFLSGTIFHLRKLRDFDHDWFEPVYRLFINYFANEAQ